VLFAESTVPLGPKFASRLASIARLKENGRRSGHPVDEIVGGKGFPNDLITGLSQGCSVGAVLPSLSRSETGNGFNLDWPRQEASWGRHQWSRKENYPTPPPLMFLANRNDPGSIPKKTPFSAYPADERSI
jgi:hypothetical protein